MSKITIVGISGAGKTCYMIGMFSKMLKGVDGFSLTSTRDFQRIKRMIQRLGDKRFSVADRLWWGIRLKRGQCFRFWQKQVL